MNGLREGLEMWYNPYICMEKGAIAMVQPLNRLQVSMYGQGWAQMVQRRFLGTGAYECQTCKNRKYKDGSNDPGVSFKTATRLSPEKAATAVRSHEREHVSREQAKARREGKEVVSQSVAYRTGICPECGRTYISGGATKTVTRGRIETGLSGSVVKGKYLDVLA